MNYCFYLLICNVLSCINLGNQLLLIINTMNIITVLQLSNFNVFLHGYFLQCTRNLKIKKSIKNSNCSSSTDGCKIEYLVNDCNNITRIPSSSHLGTKTAKAINLLFFIEFSIVSFILFI